MALRRSAGSLALRAAAAHLRRHRPHPPPPLALAAPAPAPTPTPIRRPLAPPCRHFAAPPGTQINKKRDKEEDKGLPRMNNAITAPFVRLVVDEGHDVVSRDEALQLASRMDMDLVEVDRKSDPPVCKIMDFHKEKYKRESIWKERSKAKSAIALRGGENKEVRFKGKTELKDLMVKADGITRLLERGYRVKCMAMPSGNEGEDLGTPLSRLLELIQDVCVVESGPHLDSKHAYVIVRHVKFATKKGGKKASQAIEESGKGTRSAVSEASVDGSNSEDKTVGDGLGKPDDRTISDHVKKTATHLSGDSAAQKEGQDRELKRQFNLSKSNPGAGGNRINPGQWGPQASERGLGHKDLQPGMEKRESNVQDQHPVETNRYAAMEKRQSNVQDQGPVETNRYAARRQPIRGDNNRGFNQGRPPQDDRWNENRGRYDSQRPLEQQHNRPLPRFNQGGLPQDPRNERRGPFPPNNNQRQPAGGGDPNHANKSFGIFSSTQKSGSSEQRKLDGSSKPGNTDPPKSFGIFSSRK